jgi:hypothetical protein
MKKHTIQSLKKVCLSFAAILALSSCNQNLVEQNQKDDSTERKSEISKNIERMKNAGLFDSIMEEVRAASNEESENVLRFINDTDSVLEEIAMDENGNEQLEVINALFCSGSVNDFVESFSKLNAEKSDEFLSFVNENLALESSSEQSSARCALTKEIKLSYAVSDYARGIFASDLEWSTIGWYTGYCATSIAGFYMMSYGPFWTKIAGGIAAAAGTASMIYQIKLWSDCSDLINFTKSLINKDLETATAILNTEPGRKILLITTETVATVTINCFTPAGKVIANKVITSYNTLINKILSVLPTGINYVINGIAIKPLKLF